MLNIPQHLPIMITFGYSIKQNTYTGELLTALYYFLNKFQFFYLSRLFWVKFFQNSFFIEHLQTTASTACTLNTLTSKVYVNQLTDLMISEHSPYSSILPIDTHYPLVYEIKSPFTRKVLFRNFLISEKTVK